MQPIGDNIKKFRKAKGLSQDALAKKSKLSENYIGLIERNKKIPSIDSLIKILNALEISADVILADELKVGYEVKNSMLNENFKIIKRGSRQNLRHYRCIASICKNRRINKK